MIPSDHYAGLFLRTLRERIANLEADLLKGGASDFASYRDKVGELRGLKTAVLTAQEALKAVTEEPDDE